MRFYAFERQWYIPTFNGHKMTTNENGKSAVNLKFKLGDNLAKHGLIK